MKVESGKIKKIVLLACVSIAFHIPLFSMAQYKVVHLDSPYNTPGSETAALQVGDTVLVYASMPPNPNAGAFGVKHSVTHLLQARIAKSGKLARPKEDRWGFSSKKDHTGNLAIDPVTRDAYFTRGDVETLRCDIWWAQAKKRRGWEKPERLRGAVNSKQYTATHPTLGHQPDGTVLLYFVSDRPGGYGGMDIWYSIVADGVAGEPVNLGPMVNSDADEITPFYDQRNSILYFSSDRQGGQGGHDIYCAVGSRNTWQQAEPVCHCLNSEQNDIYFTIAAHDPSGIPTAGYLSSNRRDSYFLGDSMCCNDIYRWTIDTAALLAMLEADKDTDTVVPEPTALDRFHSFAQHTFPLTLYFHNDDPDPGSRDSLTAEDYADCQLRYALMRSTYLAHQHTAADSATMHRFFDNGVVGNYDRTLELMEHLQRLLAEGHRVKLTVSGYASPLHTDDYNHILSQRRIGALINMIRAWRGGVLTEALAEGRLRVVRAAWGADKSDPTGDPVYGLPAARARRIVITACEIF